MAAKETNLYDVRLVAKYASIVDTFYEYLEMAYGEDADFSDAQCRAILQKVMADLGHPDLDMQKLNRSYRHFMETVDLEAYPEALVECPDLDKYFED